jgi:hypothetical protein
MVVRRIDFKGCEIFTARQSLESVDQAIERYLPRQKGHLHVLDAFCGAGIVGESVKEGLRKRGLEATVVSADCNEQAMMQGDIILPRVVDLRYQTDIGRFDIIVARYGLHDLSLPDKSRAVATLVGMLEERGIIVVCDIMPGQALQEELTRHHQEKEAICDGPNRKVYLATDREYLSMMRAAGLRVRKTDEFKQEVSLRNWLSTLGVTKRAIEEYERFTLACSRRFQEEYGVFRHPRHGVQMLYPIKTIVGLRA